MGSVQIGSRTKPAFYNKGKGGYLSGRELKRPERKAEN
jgi:hypothetical protein